MQKLRKYLAVSVLLLALPIAAFIGTHFVLESDKTIYNFIPQESDVVIEINTRNFISEVMYQRIYREGYFHQKIVRDKHADPIEDVGFDAFSSVVIFREQWAESDMWMALIGYTDEAKFKAFLTEELPHVHTCFGDDYVLLQLTPYAEQEKINAHMQSIMNGEVKSFKERVNLLEIFDRSKEINCYITPKNNVEGNQLLNGNISFDFLGDCIKIEGEFTPVSGFSENVPIAYALNEDAPFSLRSSLSILNSVHWFNADNIKGIPQYSQMALDYNGMNLFMVHEDLGYTIPFKQYPEMQAHFDILNYPDWQKFVNTMVDEKVLTMDTVAHIIKTNMGTYFNYTFNEKEFELARNEVQLQPCTETDLYFAFQMNVMEILENIKLGIDEENPPSEDQQMIGLTIVQAQIDEVQVMANIEDIRFELRLEDETNMKADGIVQMVNKSGHSMIESMSFGAAAVLFMADFISNPSEPVEEEAP